MTMNNIEIAIFVGIIVPIMISCWFAVIVLLKLLWDFLKNGSK